ncbi:MAG TPA: hypothetical protein VLK25_00870 [Allosphingosinicella sp.]|nr:hypothetical protein [Allosphingosinicella sp.]
MRALGAALLLLLAGCGAEPVREDKVSANQLERLSTVENETVADPLATARLQPLEPGDITHEGLGGPGCRFSIGGAVLVAAGSGDAIARIGGETLHFTHSAPVGPSGGFFEDRQISISIGRTDPAEAAARVTVTNRRTDAQLNQEGIWRCGA